MGDQRLRDRYLKVLIQALTDNAKKTIKENVDKDIILHYSISMEVDCYNKSRSLMAYTKAITWARLSIEKCTFHKKLFPTLSNALKEIRNDVMTADNVKPTKDNDIQSVSSPNSLDEKQTTQKLLDDMDDAVIVIDSDSDDSDVDATVIGNIKSENFDRNIDNNQNIVEEVLISVQTKSSDPNIIPI